MSKKPPSNKVAHSVLIVEDDVSLLKFFEEALGKFGYTVFGAISGADAKGIAEHQPIDLAVLDVTLPDTNGIDLGRHLATEYSIPFIQLTGSSDQQTIDKAVDAGAITYLVKPVELEQLIPAVETAIRRASEIGKLIKSVDNLSKDSEKRRSISIAVGIIMERFGIAQDQAFEILRFLARSRQEQIVITSSEIIAGERGFDLLVIINQHISRFS